MILFLVYSTVFALDELDSPNPYLIGHLWFKGEDPSLSRYLLKHNEERQDDLPVVPWHCGATKWLVTVEHPGFEDW